MVIFNDKYVNFFSHSRNVFRYLTTRVPNIRILFLFVTLFSCSYDKGSVNSTNTNNPTGPGVPPPVTPTNCDTTRLNWQSNTQQLIANHCSACHCGSGGCNFPKLVTQDDIINHLNSVRQEINSGSMPPNGTLDACERSKLIHWLNQGAP